MIQAEPKPETKNRILDAAERLFAERGFAETSLRAITAEAGVNLAAVNYHFQSKVSLIRAVMERRIGPLNRERLALLDALEADAGDQPVPLEKLLEAVIGPVLRLGREREGAGFKRLFGRLYTEPGGMIPRVFQEHMNVIVERFGKALRRALPQLPPVELYWRMNFTVGAMAHTLAGTYHLEVISGGQCDPTDVEGTIRRLVTFVAAGMRAPLDQRGAQL